MANRFFATAQYSRKTNHPRFGNTSTRLQDSPFLTIGRVSPGGLHFGPVYFDRTDPEDRDNNQLTGSVSYFGSKPGWGTHDVKAGVEMFSLVLRGGNSQSSTGYLFNTDYASTAGRPLTDASGRVLPVWIPGCNHRRQYAADARRRARHPNHVVLPAGSLDARAPHARPRPALRARRE